MSLPKMQINVDLEGNRLDGVDFMGDNNPSCCCPQHQFTHHEELTYYFILTVLQELSQCSLLSAAPGAQLQSTSLITLEGLDN